MRKKYLLKIDTEICRECGVCDSFLPQFRRKFKGDITFAEWVYTNLELKEIIDNMMESCTEDAIMLSECT